MTHKTLRIFIQFLYRDLYIYSQRIGTYGINYCLIYPALFSFAFCYVQPNIFFGPGHAILGSTIFIGHILIVVFVLASNLGIHLLFDLEGKRYIDYQITILDARLVLLERIIFNALFTFVMSIPFFPSARLIMQDNFDTTNTSWPLVFFMLFVASCYCAAHGQFIACFIKNSRLLRPFWLRVNFALITFGGIFIPWHILYKFSPIVGYIVLINPLIYITEGLRNAIIGGPQFISVHICIAILSGYTVVLTLFAWYYFKKRVDHI